MVAYAAQFPAKVEKLVALDALLPGVGEWEAVDNNPGFWHFRFNGPTPEALEQGRECIYFEHFWNNFAAGKTRSIPEAYLLSPVALRNMPSLPNAARGAAKLTLELAGSRYSYGGVGNLRPVGGILFFP
jgi:pimeloyl-ACP methyl ester carboxylesterase